MVPPPQSDIRLALGPHVFVEDLQAPYLDDDDRHHLSRSLRLRPGDPLTLSDGAGCWAQAQFGTDTVELAGEICVVSPPVPLLTLVIALAKGTKPELVVQKATEIGVDRIVLVAAARSVVQWDDDKQQRNLARLGRVVREAAMQSRRVQLPELAYAESVDAAQILCGSTVLHRADFDGRPIDHDVHAIAVGPEGGWNDEERAHMPVGVDLGPTVLRAETAAIVAAHHMAHLRHRTVDI